MPKLLALALLLLVLAAGTAFADEDAKTLSIGDPAPALDIEYWVKGVEMDRRGNFEPVTTFPAGQITVVEFWATWCGPCRSGMPHLSELQEHFADKGVRIIGISDESLPKVYAFLWSEDRDGKLQHERTRYTLTSDPDRSTHDDYMKAAGQTGIPTSFVVGKDGHIEWIGHPSRLDPVLEALVADTWDRDAYRAQFETEQRAKRAMMAARARLAKAAQAEDWEELVRIYDELIETTPGNARLLIAKLNVLLTKIDDRARAYAYAEEVREALWDESASLNAIAWQILDDARVIHRDLEFAMALAVRAADLTEEKDAAILDTLARAHYETGDLAKAIEWQEQAIEVAEGAMKESLAKALDAYRKERDEREGAENPGR